jgi:hypothetical protein
MMRPRPLTVIWRRRTLDLVPESYFITQVLLADLGRPVRTIAVEQLTDAPFVPGALVVSMKTEFAGYLAEARRRGMRDLMLFHLGDEHGRDDRSFYAEADLVLRNYWFDEVQSDPKVVWVPNGYALGVGPAAPGARLKASERNCAGFFAGAMAMRTLSDERHRMRAAVERAALPFQLHVTATSRDRLGPSAYAARLADARFALVPGGNSPETIRLYDALETGAVPITLRSRFIDAPDALGGAPFPVLEHWDQLPQAYAPFADGAAVALQALDALQDHVLTWWAAFKRRQQAKLRAAIGAVLDRGDRA